MAFSDQESREMEYDDHYDGFMIRQNRRTDIFVPEPGDPSQTQSSNLIDIIEPHFYEPLLERSMQNGTNRYSYTPPNQQNVNQRSDHIFYSDDDLGQPEERKVSQSYSQNYRLINQQALAQLDMDYDKKRGLQARQFKKKKKNQCVTKNMLQYFWKSTKRFFQSKVNTEGDENQLINKWNQFRNEGGSRLTFARMFNSQHLRPYFLQIFRSRYFLREIICSGIDLKLKRVYMKYVRVLFKGFKDRDLPFLN